MPTFHLTNHFCFTYGDGVGDIDITKLVAFHQLASETCDANGGKAARTLRALTLGDHGEVRSFAEKPADAVSRVNGGYFVLSPDVIELIEGDHISWEREPLNELARLGQLVAYRHDGFWQPMDTLWEKRLLNELWVSGKAPWKTW